MQTIFKDYFLEINAVQWFTTQLLLCKLLTNQLLQVVFRCAFLKLINTSLISIN